MDYVAGYCVVNDVSERAFQIDGTGQWTKGKSCDSFGPIGPWVVTADEVPNPQELSLWLEVNGKRYQDGSTKTMIFDVAHLVSYCSQHMSLQPGDIITTGTPPGVGMGLDPQVWLQPATKYGWCGRPRRASGCTTLKTFISNRRVRERLRPLTGKEPVRSLKPKVIRVALQKHGSRAAFSNTSAVCRTDVLTSPPRWQICTQHEGRGMYIDPTVLGFLPAATPALAPTSRRRPLRQRSTPVLARLQQYRSADAGHPKSGVAVKPSGSRRTSS